MANLKTFKKQKMNKHLIFFQHGLGQKKIGISKTVEKLFKHYVDLKEYPKTFIDDTFDINLNLNELYDISYSFLQNKFQNIIIGGDHSLAIASISSSLNFVKNNNLKVVWFDAHADINTLDSSPSGNMHGMPLSFLTGLSQNKFNFLQKILNFENLFYVGIRDLDNFEIEIIEKHNIRFQKCSELNVSDIVEWIGKDPVHLSFDVDCLDPFYISCTGTPVGDGLELSSVLQALKILVTNCNIIQVDLVELNLEINPEKSQNNLDNFDQIVNCFIDA